MIHSRSPVPHPILDTPSTPIFVKLSTRNLMPSDCGRNQRNFSSLNPLSYSWTTPCQLPDGIHTNNKIFNDYRRFKSLAWVFTTFMKLFHKGCSHVVRCDIITFRHDTAKFALIVISTKLTISRVFTIICLDVCIPKEWGGMLDKSLYFYISLHFVTYFLSLVANRTTWAVSLHLREEKSSVDTRVE